MSYQIITKTLDTLTVHVVTEYLSEADQAALRISRMMKSPVYVLELYCGDWIVDMYKCGHNVMSSRFPTKEAATDWMKTVICK